MKITIYRHGGNRGYMVSPLYSNIILNFALIGKKVQAGKDQEKAQSEKDSHSKNRGGKKPN